MFLTSLSDSVLKIFNDRHLTYESAALLCKLSSRQLGNILRKHSNPTLESFEKICVGLRQSPNELLGLPVSAPDLARCISTPIILIVDRVHDGSSATIPVCPYCENDLDGPKQHYCPNCGQKLDWSPCARFIPNIHDVARR